jgi:hypothetical protein
MDNFVATIAAELERERPLPKQVADHISSHYSTSRDQIGGFLKGGLDGLEDYQIDLIFSPMFTPGLADQAVFADLLDSATLPSAQWPALIQRLFDRPTLAHLTTEDGVTATIRLRAVTIERYVTRLHLDIPLAEPLSRLLNTLPPVGDRALLKAIARRPVWKAEGRHDVLFKYLLAATANHFYAREDLVALLKMAEAYQPADAADVIARIPHWQEVIKKEIIGAESPKPFFSERVQELHGGGRDQRHQNAAYVAAKKGELEFLGRLKSVLGGA